VYVHGVNFKNIDSNNKIRIKDIAKLAGVSAGTVDRVLHNRGQVSEDSRGKIQKIIEELNYKPNLLARSLASKRNYLFVTVFPEFEKNAGEYWEAPYNGVVRARKEIADHNILVKNLTFNQFDIDSFRNKIKETIDLKPDAVIIAPIFADETVELTNRLDNENIPYVFIDSNIEGVNNLAYFGQNSYQSGFIAARLLEQGLPAQAKIAIFKPAGKNGTNQSVIRENGFKAFFRKNGIDQRYSFNTCRYDINNEKTREQQIVKFFEECNPVSAAVVFNSRVCDIARTIEKLNIMGLRLIGYDLLAENIEFLRKDIITFLLAQRPEEQGYHAIMTLFNSMFLNMNISRNQYVPIDILTKENLEYYINFIK
jgi:LacI family transcriptional regulator